MCSPSVYKLRAAVAGANKFCAVEPYNGPSVWILLHVDLLAPRNWWWLLDFEKLVDP